MGSAVGSEAVAGGVAGPGAGGVVSRPRLFGRLAAPARVTAVSGPPGSCKTVLLRSWIGQASLARRAAWVPVGRGEGDPQRFWLSVLGALRQTDPSSVLVQPLTTAPDLDGWVIAQRLLKDLAPLDDRVWLLVDDVQELGPDALAQLEMLIMSGPEIASELYVSVNTVRTHMRHLYAKLGTHRRADTVACARALGLLAPSPHRDLAPRPG
jgi:LuxR family maltose regulon positive regulatory protein